MLHLLTVLLALGFIVPAPADDAQKDKEALQGTWKVTKATRGGKPPPEADKLMLLITADEITPQTGERKEGTAKYTLDPSKSPKQIDIVPPGDRKVYGIYEIKEGTLRLCFSRDGDPRPTSFDASGDRIMYIEATKEKK